MDGAIDLDHVAVATEHAVDNLDRYLGDLGGRWVGGGADNFYWGQVRFANGMRIELLEPTTDDPANFLRRFLDRNGPGPHHATFKVPDLPGQLERVRAAGYEPINVDLSGETWKESFLHPKSSWGLVVQIAWTAGGPDEPDAGLPPGRCGAPASFDRIVHLVSDLDGARGLFEGLLDGTVTDRGDDRLGEFVDLAWPGPGRLRLVRPTDERARHWLGDRAGRLHHLRFTVADPAAVRGARPTPEGEWELRPEDNRGVRLRLAAG
jgi:hypothetical protein